MSLNDPPKMVHRSTKTGRYSKTQRLAALFCVVLIVLINLATHVFSLLKFSWAQKYARIGIGLTVALPILTWGFIRMWGCLTKKKNIASLNIFGEDK